ncbi:hypothetical protein GGS26DRAFT_564782 [Hypomontagnella submonticulosa]|nr:hypothetical protein GGS26DRAFT_564782 [Hypomontagnella submonticulosa]
MRSRRRAATDPRRKPAGSPDFSHLYLPIGARPPGLQHQHQHRHQSQHQNHLSYAYGHQQQSMNSPGQQHAYQQQHTGGPVPPPDRVQRQDKLDEQALGFSEDDDEAFYPHSK